MAGIPPLIGFFSKQFVLYSALQNGYYFISYVAIIVSVISASYYLKIIQVLHTQTQTGNPQTATPIALPKVGAFTHRVGETRGVESKLDPVIIKNTSSVLPLKHTLTNTHSFLISSLTLIILLFFIKPSIILNSTQLLSLSLFYI